MNDWKVTDMTSKVVAITKKTSAKLQQVPL
jgi:hypothetical protein